MLLPLLKGWGRRAAPLLGWGGTPPPLLGGWGRGAAQRVGVRPPLRPRREPGERGDAQRERERARRDIERNLLGDGLSGPNGLRWIN